MRSRDWSSDVCSSDLRPHVGTWSADVRPLVCMDVSVIIEHQGRREQAHAGGGGRARYADVFDGDMPERYAREAVRIAVKIGRAACRESGCQYMSRSVVAGSSKKNTLLQSQSML